MSGGSKRQRHKEKPLEKRNDPLDRDLTTKELSRIIEAHPQAAQEVIKADLYAFEWRAAKVAHYPAQRGYGSTKNATPISLIKSKKWQTRTKP